tara:strand:+ start:6695 stop:7135 length:441 start_codon:yes stop_codon:yes gene_type:complete
MSNANLIAENEDLSGFRKTLGGSLSEWEPGRVVIATTIDKQHLNRNGSVHGGVLSALLDTAAGLSGTFCVVPGNIRRCGTISLNTQFMSPISDGVMRAEGLQIGRGRKIFFAEAKIFCGDTIIATAQGSFRYILGGDNENGVLVLS